MSDIKAASCLALALCCLADAQGELPTDKKTRRMIETIMKAVKSQQVILLTRNQVIELPKHKPLGDAA